MNLSTPSQTFKRFIKIYNKNHKYQLPEITFHGLRHTAATLLISQNVDIKTVSSRLGHASTSTTIDIYAHALEETDKSAANTLESLLIKKA